MYNVEMKIKDVHSSDFESDIESAIAAVKSFVQKEYKKCTKQALSLKEEGRLKRNYERILQGSLVYDANLEETHQLLAD